MAKVITDAKSYRRFAHTILNEIKKDEPDNIINKGKIRFAGNNGPIEISTKEFEKRSIKKICKRLEAETKCSLGDRLNKTEVAQLTALVSSGTKEAALQK